MRNHDMQHKIENKTIRCVSNNTNDYFISVKRVDELGSIVAFQAQFANAPKTGLKPNQIITFETVVHNFGNAYDGRTGVFICPRAGLYFFSLSLLANRGEEHETKLVVNGNTVMVNYAGGPPGPPPMHNQGTRSVIVPMQMGDKAWVAFLDYDGLLYDGIWSTLTGFLIKETY